MLPYRDSAPTRIILGLFFVLVLGYAYYEARGLIFGPDIKIPDEITVSHDPFIIIRGTAERISQLTMNGKSVSVTETGVFEEPYLLALGYNRIVLNAQDKYGRSRERVLEILYKPNGNSPIRPPEENGVARSTDEVAPE